MFGINILKRKFWILIENMWTMRFILKIHLKIFIKKNKSNSRTFLISEDNVSNDTYLKIINKLKKKKV